MAPLCPWWIGHHPPTVEDDGEAGAEDQAGSEFKSHFCHTHFVPQSRLLSSCAPIFFSISLRQWYLPWEG